MDDPVDDQHADEEDGSTTKYSVKSERRLTTPNRIPRGTAWMPSSPPVKGACSEKKYTIWAKASVTMAK
jgi:hypothetical protein